MSGNSLLFPSLVSVASFISIATTSQRPKTELFFFPGSVCANVWPVNKMRERKCIKQLYQEKEKGMGGASLLTNGIYFSEI